MYEEEEKRRGCNIGDSEICKLKFKRQVSGTLDDIMTSNICFVCSICMADKSTTNRLLANAVWKGPFLFFVLLKKKKQ